MAFQKPQVLARDVSWCPHWNLNSPRTAARKRADQRHSSYLHTTERLTRNTEKEIFHQKDLVKATDIHPLGAATEKLQKDHFENQSLNPRVDPLPGCSIASNGFGHILHSGAATVAH